MFCIHFIYILIDSVYKFHIFNKQFIFEHFFKKLMYMKCIRKKLIMWNVYGVELEHGVPPLCLIRTKT
jgi:hypothetical protein